MKNVRFTVGPLEVRTCRGGCGERLPGHVHNFAHATFAREGWIMVRHKDMAGAEKIAQLATLDYRKLRALQLKHEPENVMRPVRFADAPDENGKLRFDIRWITPDASVPEGAKEIVLEDAALEPPFGYWLLIEQQTLHEIVVLSESGGLDCTFPHRDYSGKIMDIPSWQEAYR